VTTPRKIFWIGLFTYAVSFFTFAVAGRGPGRGPARGYFCAYAALVLPLNTAALQQGRYFEDRMVEYISLVISGLINPLFVLTVILMLTSRCKRFVDILKIIVALMIPSCWVVFHYEDFYPREGHFLWIMGMLLVLYSDKLARTPASSPVGREISV
jgi:hypothetical protein